MPAGVPKRKQRELEKRLSKIQPSKQSPETASQDSFQKTVFNLQLRCRISKDASHTDRFTIPEIQYLIDKGQVKVDANEQGIYFLTRIGDGKIIAEIEQFTQPKTY